jgi:tight adherence protein B
MSNLSQEQLNVLIFVAFLTFSFLCVLLVTGSSPEEAALKKRVHAILPGEGDAPNKTGRTYLVAKAARDHSGRLRTFATQFKTTKQLQRLVLQSGTSATLSVVLRWSLAIASALGVTIYLLTHMVNAGCAGFIAGSFAPFLALRWMRKKRIERFAAALPDAIELMARSLRAGHSLSAALEIVGDQAAQPLAGEFELVARQQQLGAMFRDTLLELAERMPSQDLHFLITAMLVQRENGGDLTQVLDRTAKVISERLRIAGEVRTYSAQGRLTGWILSALPVVLLILVNIANPGYSKLLFSDPLGRMMLAGAVLSIAAGMFTIRKIVDIKV